MPVLPAKDHSRVISLGIYTGATVQYDYWDWNEAFDLIYPTPYNWISVHGISPWDNPDSRFMLERDESGKFYTGKPDLKYYANFEKMLDEGARHDIGIEYSFHDQYHVRKWLYSKWKTSKYHWLRNNDARIDWGGPDIATAGVRYNWETHIYPLYGNWNHHDPSNPKNFYWFQFKTDANDDLISYKPVNKIGEAIIDYYKKIFDIVAAVKARRPRLRFRYKGFNESNLFTYGGEWAGGRDIDERTLRLLRKLAKERGLTPNAWFREYVDVRIEAKETGQLDLPRHRQLNRAIYPVLGEIHGMDNAKEIPALDYSRNLLSSDGANEDNYHSNMTGIAKLKLKMFDYKMVPNKPWNSRRMIENLKNSIVPMSDIHKGIK